MTMNYKWILVVLGIILLSATVQSNAHHGRTRKGHHTHTKHGRNGKHKSHPKHDPNHSRNPNAGTCSGSLFIQELASLDEALSKATKEFIASRPSPITTVNAAVMIPVTNGQVGYLPNPFNTYLNHNTNDTHHSSKHHTRLNREHDSETFWQRGTLNGTHLIYPASCVKLAYLVASTHWCKQNNQPFDCVDSHTRPMIQVSDNLETGYVVDRISQQRNIFHVTESDPEFKKFVNQRSYTQNLFKEHDLLGNQVLLHKTYPTNSGSIPIGAEGILRQKYGTNLMNPICSATIMAEIVSGRTLVPESSQYLQHMLFHPRRSYSIFGWGMPPGTLMYTKLGNAYNNLNEIAYIILPNKKSFVLSAFTDSYESGEPQLNNLGRFAELVLQNIPSLSEGLKYSILEAKQLDLQGSNWKREIARDAFGEYFYSTNIVNGSHTATWTVQLSDPGLYEISTWNPESSAYGIVTITLNYYTPDLVPMKSSYRVNQRYNGGRWIPLADEYIGNKYPVKVTVEGKTSGSILVANAIRFASYPEEF